MQFTSLGPVVPITSVPSLSQAPPPAPLPAPIPQPGGEPDLNAALSSLTADEAAEYQAWGPKEKLLFLMGYQWTAVMTAPELRRPDGSPFIGMLPAFHDAAYGALSAAQPFFKNYPADMAKTADDAASIVFDAQSKALARGRDLAKRYGPLRDRVAWELATSGVTVEFEVVGDDPSNPGTIYVRRIGPGPDADISAVFSTKTPKALWGDGLNLEDKYGKAGVVFKKLDMSGPARRLSAGPSPVLAGVIATVVQILGFFWFWQKIQTEKKLDRLGIASIQTDPKLSDADKADRVARIQTADAMWDSIFGSGGFPWAALAVGAAVIGIAFFLVPALIPGEGR